MTISADVLVTHLDYSKYASMLLLEACGKLPAEEVERDLKSSHGGILGTLQHTFFGDRVWLSRLEEAPRKFRDEGESPSLAELGAAWPPLLDRFKSCVAGIGDAGVMQSFTFKNLAGQEFTMPRWQAVLHVVNHGSVHRGQVAAMIRQLGHTPPATDLIYYYRR